MEPNGMTEETDEEIGKWILERFSDFFKLGPQDELKEEFVETRGRKPVFWHPLAITYVRKREAAGVSRNQACREFRRILKNKHNYNVTLGTVLDAVRSHYGRPYRSVAREKFATAILDNDLDATIKWSKRLSPKERRRWGFE